MAVQTFYLPVARRLMEWERLTGQVQPEARETFDKEARGAEQTLNDLLEKGWVILAHSEVSVGDGILIAFVLQLKGA